MSSGGAEVSSKHANFIIANSGCTATDVMNLMKQIQRRVQEEKGVILESEVQIWP
jgi:UDP-N-acetylmuramate dehydrogenase